MQEAREAVRDLSMAHESFLTKLSAIPEYRDAQPEQQIQVAFALSQCIAQVAGLMALTLNVLDLEDLEELKKLANDRVSEWTG
jgi:hypothetical protein